MSNKAAYRAMMDQVRAPERVLGKAKDITMEKSKRAPLALKYATVTVASLLSVFVVTNGVCYAATGETWVEHFTMTVDGQPVDITVKALDTEDERIGEVVVTATGDIDDVAYANGDDAGLAGEDVTVEESGFYVYMGDDDAMVVEGDDGTVQLMAKNGKVVDITDDIADGRAEGTVTVDGATRTYTVTGTPGAYEVQLD